MEKKHSNVRAVKQKKTKSCQFMSSAGSIEIGGIVKSEYKL